MDKYILIGAFAPLVIVCGLIIWRARNSFLCFHYWVCAYGYFNPPHASWNEKKWVCKKCKKVTIKHMHWHPLNEIY